MFVVEWWLGFGEVLMLLIVVRKVLPDGSRPIAPLLSMSARLHSSLRLSLLQLAHHSYRRFALLIPPLCRISFLHFFSLHASIPPCQFSFAEYSAAAHDRPPLGLQYRVVFNHTLARPRFIEFLPLVHISTSSSSRSARRVETNP